MLKYEDFMSLYRTRLPVSFDNSLDLYEQFISVVEHFNELIKNNNSIVDFIYLSKKEQDKLIEGIQKDLDDFLVNKEKYFVKFIKEWLENNMEEIMSNATKMVWFGLDDDGYFIAVIPESWNEIDFDTTINGELILQY